MKTNSNFPNMPASKLLYAGILVAGSIGNVLLSPKWAVPVLAWIAPACMLFYFRYATVRFKVLWFLLALIVSQMISSYDVAPFPLPVLAIVSVIGVLKVLAVYFIDRWVSKKINHFITTLIFLAALVTKEFFDITFSGGAWWSIANTQYPFNWLTQLASVTGLTGISFLIYWFASVALWCIEKYFNKEKFIKGVWIYASVFTAVMIFGLFRFYSNDLDHKSTVKIAGLSVPTIGILENCYKDVYHQNISIDLKSSMMSKELQKVNATLVPFIEDPGPSKFINGYNAMNGVNDSLFVLSQQAADNGAKIIVWSEANAVMPSAMQDRFIQRGETFASKNKVYLLMTIAAFQPGKITPEKIFLENKAILVGPGGKILNVFHKNHPVPFVEHSVPGDGKIPAIATPYGIISTSICYDADMPTGMRQLAQNKSDVLLLPSGDWYDIAPYHSYMAMFRGIENGCTVVRQASGGLSLVTDYRGKAEASFDFYKPGTKFWMTDIVTGHVPTIYSHVGDAFAYACIIITVIALLFLTAQFFLKRTSVKFSKLNMPQPA
jgi:apolipoprotein N-acyltransferase